MKRLASVVLVSVTLLASLFSEATRGNSLEPPGAVWASEKRVPVTQTQSGVTTRISVASNGTQGNAPSLSADGCYVAFDSFASNLVSGDTNGLEDVFVHASTVYVYLSMVRKAPLLNVERGGKFICV